MRVDKKIGSFWGYVWRFGGSDGGPQGFRWLIYTPMTWMEWVKKKIGVIGNFGLGDGSLILSTRSNRGLLRPSSRPLRLTGWPSGGPLRLRCLYFTRKPDSNTRKNARRILRKENHAQLSSSRVLMKNLTMR